MEDKYGVVYKIKNNINNKVYIGVTTKPNGFKGRYCGRGEGAERVYNYFLSCLKSGSYINKHLFDSLTKYGYENFSVDEEFEVCYSKEELMERERYWIKHFKSQDCKYGYNIAMGGEGVDINIRLLNKNLLNATREAFYYNKDINKYKLGELEIVYNHSNDRSKREEIEETWRNRHKTNNESFCPICGRKIIKKLKKDIVKDMICSSCSKNKLLLKSYKTEHLRDYMEQQKKNIIDKISPLSKLDLLYIEREKIIKRHEGKNLVFFSPASNSYSISEKP